MHAQSLTFSDSSMTVQFDDGRALSVPLTWYPRLLHGTPGRCGDFRGHDERLSAE